ncbi:MAG: Scr1 family TA system antitoxin-like transcriptional regulator [Pseudonocardiaceae bacterium]
MATAASASTLPASSARRCGVARPAGKSCAASQATANPQTLGRLLILLGTALRLEPAPAAKMRRVRETLIAVGTADDQFADSAPANDPPWMAYYDAAQHNGDTGHALFDLAIHGRSGTEATTRLTAAAGAVQTLLGQLDRLVAVIGLSSVELGVVPFSTPLPVFPLTGFTLYDDTVLIETITGQQRLHAADEVALYARFFDQLREAAATGADAIELIQRAAAELRGRP